MSAMDPVPRLLAIGNVLARKRPAVLAAMIRLLESVLAVIDLDIAAGRMPTVPVVLTAEQVLEAARARGVPAFAAAAGERLILLSSLGLDIADPGIRAALLELRRRRELTSPASATSAPRARTSPPGGSPSSSSMSRRSRTAP